MTKPRGRPRSDDLLTPAEWRVLEGVRHGMTNPEIARRQEVSVDAVKYHVANALQKLGLSNRGELRVWNGVRRDSALHRKAPAMNDEITLGPIGQLSRTVKDIVAARAWYADTLGLSHLYSFGNLAFFDCAGLRLFLSEGEGGATDSILYFRVDDIRSAHAGLAARGIEFTHAPHLIHTHADGTEEWMAFFRDNEGRPLALISQVAPQG